MDEVKMVFAVIVIGLGATAFMDVFAWVQSRFFRIQGLNCDGQRGRRFLWCFQPTDIH